MIDPAGIIRNRGFVAAEILRNDEVTRRRTDGMGEAFMLGTSRGTLSL
jgi:hypothetical protein